MKDTARKIAFFKLLNSGQICIGINQIAVAEEVAEAFLQELKAAFEKQIGPDALKSGEYPHLISRTAYDKCAATAEQYHDRIIYGGYGDETTLRFAPTILYPIGIEEEVVMREHFYPVLPVAPFPDAEIDRVLDIISQREHGLALYLFIRDRSWAQQVMSSQQYGVGCINEVCMQMLVKGAPFGGTGHSGMGAYHGVWGFREFTHPSTILFGLTYGAVPFREHPYNIRLGWFKAFVIRLFER